MPRAVPLSVVLVIAASSVVLGACGQTDSADARVAAGKALYDEHCAGCHGPGGNVREAPQYDPATPDLRRIASESAGGRMPRAALVQVIDGRQVIRGHGRTMPVWGELLGGDEESTESGIRSLVAYIESIQVR